MQDLRQVEGRIGWRFPLDLDVLLAFVVVLSILFFVVVSRGQVRESYVWKATGMRDTQVRALAVDTDNNIVYAGSVETGVYRTRDGGMCWEAIKEGLANPRTYALAVDSTGNVYAGTFLAEGDNLPGGVYKLPSGGYSWEEKGIHDKTVYALSIDSDDNIYVGTTGGAYRSTDRGDTWEECGLANKTVSALTVAGNPGNETILAGTWGGPIYQLTDCESRGWEKISPPRKVYALAYGSDGVVYAGTSDGVWVYKINKGRWDLWNGGLGNNTVIYSLVTESSTNTIYVGTEVQLHTYLPLIAKGPDQRTVAVPLTPSSQTLLLTPAPSRVPQPDVYIGVYDTTNDVGQPWQPSGLHEQAFSLLVSPVDPLFVYAGTYKGIWKYIPTSVPIDCPNTPTSTPTESATPADTPTPTSNPSPTNTLTPTATHTPTPETGTIRVAVYEDKNGNREYDPTVERPVDGACIILFDEEEKVIGEYEDTDEQNLYHDFSDLLTGQYTVVEKIPPGYTSAAGQTEDDVIVALSAPNLVPVEFANRRAVVPPLEIQLRCALKDKGCGPVFDGIPGQVCNVSNQPLYSVYILGEPESMARIVDVEAPTYLQRQQCQNIYITVRMKREEWDGLPNGEVVKVPLLAKARVSPNDPVQRERGRGTITIVKECHR